jgi:hypothetical protein
MKINFFWIFILFCSCALAQSDIEIEIKPEKVITYQDKDSWSLNFDFFISNNSSENLALDYLELKVFSEEDKLIWKRHLSNNGLPGALSTISKDLPAKDDLYIFNPFHSLPNIVFPHKLVYTLYFGDTSQEVIVLPELHNPMTYLQLPVTEKAFIDDGNDYYSHHRRVSLNSDAAKSFGMDKLAQRFALDFTKIDSLGNRRTEELTSNSSWYGWDMKIISPGKGTVVKVRNDVPDNEYQASGQLEYSKEVKQQSSVDISAGNYIIIDHQNGEYSGLNHFKMGSIVVKEGDQVDVGDFLGNVGLSGDTYYPHLHYQLQTSPSIIDSYGIPIVFNDFSLLANDEIEIKSAVINSGDMVEPNPENKTLSYCKIKLHGNQLIGKCTGGIYSNITIELPDSFQRLDSTSLFKALPVKGIVTLQGKYDIDVDFVKTNRAGFNQVMLKPIKVKRLGWYTFDDLRFTNEGMTFTIDSDPVVPVSKQDLQILQKAKELLKNAENWNPNDDRKCKDDIENNKYSIYCALETASIDVVGEYNHRNAVMQLMRHLIAEEFPERGWEHRFKDYNNMSETKYEDILNLIEKAKKQMTKQLINNPN